MRFIAIILLVLLACCDIAQAQVVYFPESEPVSTVFTVSKQMQRPVLMKFYTDWCVQCKRMDEEVFGDVATSTYINENFIAVKVDGELLKDYEFVEKYAIKAFPTTLILDETGKVLSRLIGYYGQIPLNEELRSVIRTRQATARN
ncbi:MAG: thioredoxin family protein [Saprospiraceae bacterium]|nr:thioredoxin family protein [Saprospiraceae bacterium]MBP7679999.1 thioredoxin family protein [Saprospiraceae bacterium]